MLFRSGFDFGNSPSKIERKLFEGRDVGIATSNGTIAIVKTKGSKITLISSFLNLSKVTEYLNNNYRDSLLVCSGWKGSTNLEDTMCAGAIVAGLENYDYESDTVIIAKKLYEQSKNDILSCMKKSSHAKRLSGYNNIEDIKFCSEIDKQEILPYLNGDKIMLL